MECIYQMFTRLGEAGFFVKRASWPNRQAGARVISVGGQTKATLLNKPLDHTEAPDSQKPKVIAAISYYGEPARVQELMSPDTYAYVLIERPDGWKEVPTHLAEHIPNLSGTAPSGGTRILR